MMSTLTKTICAALAAAACIGAVAFNLPIAGQESVEAVVQDVSIPPARTAEAGQPDGDAGDSDGAIEIHNAALLRELLRNGHIGLHAAEHGLANHGKACDHTSLSGHGIPHREGHVPGSGSPANGTDHTNCNPTGDHILHDGHVEHLNLINGIGHDDHGDAGHSGPSPQGDEHATDPSHVAGQACCDLSNEKHDGTGVLRNDDHGGNCHSQTPDCCGLNHTAGHLNHEISLLNLGGWLNCVHHENGNDEAQNAAMTHGSVSNRSTAEAGDKQHDHNGKHVLHMKSTHHGPGCLLHFFHELAHEMHRALHPVRDHGHDHRGAHKDSHDRTQGNSQLHGSIDINGSGKKLKSSIAPEKGRHNENHNQQQQHTHIARKGAHGLWGSIVHGPSRASCGDKAKATPASVESYSRGDSKAAESN